MNSTKQEAAAPAPLTPYWHQVDMSGNPYEQQQIAPSAHKACTLALEWIKEHTLELASCQPFVTWALSGGSTPRMLYQQLAAEQLPWDKIRLFLVDERDVELESSSSNLGMILRSGLGERIPSCQIFSMRSGPFSEGSCNYSELLRSRTWQGRLDLVLLGMGSDGHTASLFPHTPAGQQLDREQLLVTHPIPTLQMSWRCSLSFECLLRTRQMLFYLVGQDKRAALERVWHDPACQMPAALLRRWRLERQLPIDWVVDADAAGVVSENPGD